MKDLLSGSIIAILFIYLVKVYAVNRKEFEAFWGKDLGEAASLFRWNTEKAGKVMNENFGSSLVPTASVTSGFSKMKNSGNENQVFQMFSENFKANDKKLGKAANYRFGDLNSSFVEKMVPVNHIKLNKKMKKCKFRAELIGGRRGVEYFRQCKRAYNQRLKKPSTRKHIQYGTSTLQNMNPSNTNRLLKSNISATSTSFRNNNMSYLDNKPSERIFKKEFFGKQPKNKNERLRKIQHYGKIFRKVSLFLLSVLLFFISYNTIIEYKQIKRNNVNNF